MIEVYKSAIYEKCFSRLRDRRAKAAVEMRIERLTCGHWGDIKSVGNGVYEMRIHYGPGYRLYCAQPGKTLVVLLCGGDKNSQSKDIAAAKEIAANMEF